MPILKLKPACKDYLWGGERLRGEYRVRSDCHPPAEAWMLSCHPDGPSSSRAGPGTAKACRSTWPKPPPPWEAGERPSPSSPSSSSSSTPRGTCPSRFIPPTSTPSPMRAASRARPKPGIFWTPSRGQGSTTAFKAAPPGKRWSRPLPTVP